MAYWLFKTEPGDWSWDDQVKAGPKGSEWTGVRNPVARNNLRAMKKGDRGFFYHTGDEKQVVGIVEIVKEGRPENGAADWTSVDISAVAPLKRPVTLAAVKAEARLAEMALARQPRLSVQPVTDAEWKLVSKMGGLRTGLRNRRDPLSYDGTQQAVRHLMPAPTIAVRGLAFPARSLL